MKKRTVPKRIWLVLDTDPKSLFYSQCFPTRIEADEECRRLNAVPGYAPSCKVVAYRAAPSTGGRR